MKTAGRVAVAPLGLPSAVAMETVGRDAIFVVSTGVRVVDVVVIRGLKIEALTRCGCEIFRLVLAWWVPAVP